MIHHVKCISKEHPSLKWPEMFVAVPFRGDLIKAVGGPVTGKGEAPTLRVVNVTHTSEIRDLIGGKQEVPIIEIELV